MKSPFRYMTAAPKEVIGQHEMEYMMQIAFSIGKNNEVQLCFGDTIKIDDFQESQQMTDYAYPNQGEELHSKEGLWLSMFTRHMDDASMVEIELEE
jgi:hypothetical protein